MEEHREDPENAVSLQGMLGYLNFSEGKPDFRFQTDFNNAYALFARRGSSEPWSALHDALRDKLRSFQGSDSGPFREVKQAEGVLSLVFSHLLPAYQRFHADLLFHQTESNLWQPFFLVRAIEAVLRQGGPWNLSEEERIIAGALAHLNDFVGHRPLALLETRPKGEPYPHERIRPIPVYLQHAGVAWGPYHDLVAKALAILKQTDPAILRDASFDPDLLEELAFDPRAYDHGHPVNRRPNYVFGEWDPHWLDNQGRYRRYVIRQITLDALLHRLSNTEGRNKDELLFEAAAVLAGTMLMASGISGPGAVAHDSTTTLSTLMPRIARYRDTFYESLLSKLEGGHATRMAEERITFRQPFGAARQALNQFLSQHRAAQLQYRHVALLFAEMGYPEASRQEAARIPAASVRILGEIIGRLISGRIYSEQGRYLEAAKLTGEIENLLRRGIACGALVDPWNILGFQGLFPLFQAQEDTIRDPRIDELVYVVEQLFDLYARLLSETAAAGNQEATNSLKRDFRRLSAWWDRFATLEVGDVRRVHGAESVASAEHLASAMARWHERGESTGDLAFWQQHLEGFRSPKAFFLVLDALLLKKDYRASMALLMNWLNQAEQVPLEDGPYSFHTMALRWMLEGTHGSGAPGFSASLVEKFFDYLEANADDFWQIPRLDLEAGEKTEGRPTETLYEAAYEEVTFQDSTDDDQESSVAEGGPRPDHYDLEFESERLVKRLRFQATLARLWQIAARMPWNSELPVDQWLLTAVDNQRRLLELLDSVYWLQIPQPSGAYESLVEYDRRRVLKEQLLYHLINTCLDTTLAIGTFQGLRRDATELRVTKVLPFSTISQWGPLAVQLEQALFDGAADEVRKLLPPFIAIFQEEPLLFTSLADGGHPRQILRARLAQNVIRALLAHLPQVGLLRETFHLLKTAHRMEQTHPPQGRSVTEFNNLFQVAYQSVVRTVVDSASAWGLVGIADQELVNLLETITGPFFSLWIDHGRNLQLSVLESVRGDKEWTALRNFIQRYGRDLFHARFLTLANLRGILHRKVGVYLDYLNENPDPLHPVRLLSDLGQGISRDEAIRHVQCVLQALIENFEEYKDYNTTTTQSDYGENLYTLLDFLRLKASYDREAWHLLPLVLAHEILARKDMIGTAVRWQEPFTRFTQEWADQHLSELDRLEKLHGMRLRTVSDRLQERFVKPLALDRLCSLLEPAIRQASTPGDHEAFRRLQEELKAFTEAPAGVGLDVPHWLRRLEAECQRARASLSTVSLLAEDFFRISKVSLSLEDVQRQIKNWDEPSPG